MVKFGQVDIQVLEKFFGVVISPVAQVQEEPVQV